MRYSVTRLHTPPVIDADWNKSPWPDIKPITLNNFLGPDKPEHRPVTQAKVAYDDDALYVIFRVEDRYVRAVAPQHQACVCSDSCAEFFFIPGTPRDAGYFNIEANCGGTMLFHFQAIPREDATSISMDNIAEMQIAHSLPAIVDPEITEPTAWTVAYRLPINILEHYAAVVQPAPGVVWPANFYKCADDTSHPHWLTWAHVDPSPRGFHHPDAFGELVFA